MTSTCYLVTSGAGFLGINFCRYLLWRGHWARSLDIAPSANPKRTQMEVIDGDSRDAAGATRAMSAVEIMVHAAIAGMEQDGNKRQVDARANAGALTASGGPACARA